MAESIVADPFCLERNRKPTLRLMPARFPTCLLICFACSPTFADVDYLKEIKPLLIEKCVSCHGPVKQEAGLRLDAVSLIKAGSENGAVFNLDAPAKSPLLERVSTHDELLRMPPEGEGEPLNAEQLARFKEWIQSGMPAPKEDVLERPEDHWAYQRIERPQVASGGHPVDAFIKQLLERQGLQPAERAERGTLLRRITLDLTGLPPTPEDLRSVAEGDWESVWNSTVDRLLNDPGYGERWGRHWMDVWRYSDWDGYKNQLRGSQRHIWHWRDWIVESLNSNKPYDQMIVEMLAGDEYAPGDPKVVRATGFLARNYHNSNRNIWLDATVEHVSKAFLGMTVNCARCHDHKFDPIAMPEYYEFRAVFEPYKVRTDRVPGQLDVNKDGIPRVFDEDLAVKTFIYQQGNEKLPDKENPVGPDVPEAVAVPFEIEAVDLPPLGYYPDLAPHVEQEQLAAAEKQLQNSRNQWKKFSSETNESDAVPALPESLSTEEELARLKLLAAETNLKSLKLRWRATRASIADTTEAEQKRLNADAAQAERYHAVSTARLKQFESWQKLEAANHSDEKDANKKSAAIKKASEELAKSRDELQKTITAQPVASTKFTSPAKKYPEQSTGRRLALAKWIADPRNPLTARVAVNQIWMRHFGSPLVANVFDFGLRSPSPNQRKLLDWLAAEFIDSGWDMKHLHRLILTSQAYQRSSHASADAVAHNREIDPENEYYWRFNIQRLDAEVIRDSVLSVAGKLDRKMGGPEIDYEQGEEVHRRSLYFRHAYEKQMLMLTTFDAASPNECYRRSTSIIPQQALVMANSKLTLEMAQNLADELSGAHADREQFVPAAFVRVLGREPMPEETTACFEFLDQQAERLQKLGAENAVQRAHVNLVHVLMNHNDFVTVR